MLDLLALAEWARNCGMRLSKLAEIQGSLSARRRMTQDAVSYRALAALARAVATGCCYICNEPHKDFCSGEGKIHDTDLINRSALLRAVEEATK